MVKELEWDEGDGEYLASAFNLLYTVFEDEGYEARVRFGSNGLVHLRSLGKYYNTIAEAKQACNDHWEDWLAEQYLVPIQAVGDNALSKAWAEQYIKSQNG